MWFRHGLRVVVGTSAVLVALLLVAAPVTTAATAADVWSKPVVLFSTTGFTNSPVLVADPAGDVHLFFWYSEDRGAEAPLSGVIMYARWHRGVWSKPIDVQALPDGSAKQAVALDDRGYLHLVWLGPITHRIYYSRAHVAEANLASAWTKPVPFSGPDAADGAFGTPDAIAAVGDMVHVLYAGGGRVTYIQSTDGGQTWLAPATIGDARAQDMGTDDPRIVADRQGHVFATWTQYALPSAWPPTATYFARSTDGGNTWSDGVRVSGLDHALLTPVVDDGNRLFRMWGARGEIGEHVGQWSSDAGVSWSPAERILSGAENGLSGFPGMAFDSLGRLQIAFTGGGGTRVATSDGARWTTPILVSQGSVGRTSVESPTLTISQGNQLHVAWEDDFERIWYTSRLTDAPSIPVQAIPPPPIVPVRAPATPVPVSALPGLVVRPTATPRSTPVDASIAPPVEIVQTRSGPMWPLLGAGLISVLLLAVVVAVRLRR